MEFYKMEHDIFTLGLSKEQLVKNVYVLIVA